MCLILVVWRGQPTYPCVIAANRDEFYARATQPAHWWSDDPHILAGRDLVAGGTWLGVTRTGRFAALTNYRAPRQKWTDAPSRGALVKNILDSGASVEEELAHLRRVSADYNDFNVLFSDGERLGVYESVRREGRELGPGIYGLSNHLLDTPWPKVQRAKAGLQAALGDLTDPGAILALLRDDMRASDEHLPRTGVSLDWERLLSSAFIRGTDYGTRCSTVIRVDQCGTAFFDEWSWDESGSQSGRTSIQFDISAAGT
jgi:uncharacterized protein with NRDE domain